MLRPSLQLRVAQKQILTPGLVQMVTVLQLNRLELKEMITQEIVENPVLEESTEEVGEEITAEELLPLLEPERVTDPSDQQLLEAALGDAAHTNGIAGEAPAELGAEPFQETAESGARPTPSSRPPPPIRSTKSISAPSSTTIWIPATRAPPRSPSRNPHSRLSCPRQSPWPIICTPN